MDSIFDAKRAWNWGTNILSGGLVLLLAFLLAALLAGLRQELH